MKSVKNISGKKLTFMAGVSLSPNQTRNFSNKEIESCKDSIKFFVDSKLIEITNPQPAQKTKE